MSTPEAPSLSGRASDPLIEGSRASVGQVDGAGSGGLVDPGVALAACWVFIVGSLSAGEGRQAGACVVPCPW